jgi:hypothetical protein
VKQVKNAVFCSDKYYLAKAKTMAQTPPPVVNALGIAQETIVTTPTNPAPRPIAFNQGSLGTRAPEPTPLPEPQRSVSANAGQDYVNATNASIRGAIQPSINTSASDQATTDVKTQVASQSFPVSNTAGLTTNQVAAQNFQANTNANILSAIQTKPVSSIGGSPIKDSGPGTNKSMTGPASQRESKPTFTDPRSADDWRVRLSLAPNADYLYRAARDERDILLPLKVTNGVIFPYTPTISTSYTASYDPVDLTHTNYKFYQYRNSAVGDISISGEFTAQDTNEARYLLAVIHFFKSVTKMFYGNDTNPPAGTPPPLLYLSGYGAYQFDNHPVVISNFSYSLPADVDYIRATPPKETTGTNLQPYSPLKRAANSSVGNLVGAISKLFRLENAGITKGAENTKPQFTNLSTGNSTYVPTKMTISIQCLPVVNRYDISNNFSVEKYARGALTRGSEQKSGGGIW